MGEDSSIAGVREDGNVTAATGARDRRRMEEHQA